MYANAFWFTQIIGEASAARIAPHMKLAKTFHHAVPATATCVIGGNRTRMNMTSQGSHAFLMTP